MSPTRPFRFSVQAVEASNRRQWEELARKVEDLGFSVLMTADHLDECMSPLAPLVTAAEVTENLRVGVLVLNNDFRHPSLVAREAATIDMLTDGRLELGLGAGHAWPEYRRNGLEFDPPGTRVRRLAESTQILRRLLDGDRVTFNGEHYRLEAERCHPRPAQRHVPLLVGGGSRRVLSIAARWADSVGFTGLGRTLEDGNRHDPSGFPPAAVEAQVTWVQSQAGERIHELELQVLVQQVVVSHHPRQVAEEIVTQRLPSLRADDILTTPYLLVGSVAGLVERLFAQRERWGFSHYTVRADALDTFAPVVAELAGR